MEKNDSIGLSACVTTMNAPGELSNCLSSLWNSSVKPDWVVVADDSQDLQMQQQNRNIVEQYDLTIYVVGSHKGVCANRNRAFEALPPTDFVAFVDDDICVESDFIAKAKARYKTLTPKARKHTFLTGGKPTKLSFRGFFRPSQKPLCVDLHTAVFPTTFFQIEKWDEKIFFGYEDALLCLRAIASGFKILHCPELNTIDNRAGKSTLKAEKVGKLTRYDIYIEAARLYVGIERYKNIFPNPLKLISFLLIYFIHMTIYLLKNRAFQARNEIFRYSNLKHLLQSGRSQSTLVFIVGLVSLITL